MIDRFRGRMGPLALAALLLVALSSTAEATSIVRLSELPELVEESKRAVLAEVVGVRYDLDEARRPSTWVTLRVDEPLYGEKLPAPGGELTIKLFGAPVVMQDGQRIFIDGTPLYRTGDRYLLLLIKESKWGYTNTAGLFQGAVPVVANDRGEAVARKLTTTSEVFGKGGLGEWLDPSKLSRVDRDRIAKPGAEVPYRLLRQAVLDIWTSKGGESWQADGLEKSVSASEELETESVDESVDDLTGRAAPSPTRVGGGAR